MSSRFDQICMFNIFTCFNIRFLVKFVLIAEEFAAVYNNQELSIYVNFMKCVFCDLLPIY